MASFGRRFSDRFDVMGMGYTPSVAVIMRAMAVGVRVRVYMGVFRHRRWQEAHLRSQHPAADPDDENAGAESEVCLDTLRDKPSRAERREDRHQDNPARVGQRDEDPEDERIDGTTARTDNVRSRDRLPVPRGRRVYRAQPKAGEEVEGAFSHSLAPREQGGKASWLPPLKGAGGALS